MSKADEMMKDLGYRKQEGLREINYYRGNDEIIFYKDFVFSKKDLKTILNLIQKQDTEIKKLKQKIIELENENHIPRID